MRARAHAQTPANAAACVACVSETKKSCVRGNRGWIPKAAWGEERFLQPLNEGRGGRVVRQRHQFGDLGQRDALWGPLLRKVKALSGLGRAIRVRENDGEARRYFFEEPHEIGSGCRRLVLQLF